MSHIIIYADDFSYDIWEEYCEICGVDPSATSISISFDEDDVIPRYED